MATKSPITPFASNLRIVGASLAVVAALADLLPPAVLTPDVLGGLANDLPLQGDEIASLRHRSRLSVD